LLFLRLCISGQVPRKGEPLPACVHPVKEAAWLWTPEEKPAARRRETPRIPLL